MTSGQTEFAAREWAEQIRKRFAGAKVAVCRELARGPIVSALIEHDSFVVFLFQPSLLAKYRAAFTPSRGKDDPTVTCYCDARCMSLSEPDLLGAIPLRTEAAVGESAQ